MQFNVSNLALLNPNNVPGTGFLDPSVGVMGVGISQMA